MLLKHALASGVRDCPENERPMPVTCARDFCLEHIQACSEIAACKGNRLLPTHEGHSKFLQTIMYKVHRPVPKFRSGTSRAEVIWSLKPLSSTLGKLVHDSAYP